MGERVRKASRALQRSSAQSSNDDDEEEEDSERTSLEKSTDSVTNQGIVYKTNQKRRNAGASVVTLSRFIKKKPRPREIIRGITEKKAKKLARQKEKRKGANHQKLHQQVDNNISKLDAALAENSEHTLNQQSIVCFED